MTEDLLVERVQAIEAYRPLFAAAFRSETVTLRRIGYALSSFERTLLAADSPFDRWWFGKEEGAYYSLGFWINPKARDMPKLFPNTPTDVFFAAGHYGQNIIVFPKDDLMIVRMDESRPPGVSMLSSTAASPSAFARSIPRVT